MIARTPLLNRWMRAPFAAAFAVFLTVAILVMGASQAQAADVSNSLVFIKTYHTGTGTVEVHAFSRASGYSARQVGTGSGFSTRDDGNGVWQISGNDLYFIKLWSTGSGRVEVHAYSGASNYQTKIVAAASGFSAQDATNGTWQIVGRDLYFIKSRNTGSGRVEVHAYSGASNYQTKIIASATAFSTQDDRYGIWQMDAAGNLYFIKTWNTGTGTVEVHALSRSSNYQSRIVGCGSGFSTRDAGNGTWQILGNDLYFIKYYSTGSGRVEVHAYSGQSCYKTKIIASPSALSAYESVYGHFSVH